MPTLTSFAPQLLALEGVTPQPWKNGGGVTRELAAWPPGATMADFDWRVSVADIAVDGPFSAFPGIDRQILLLDGAGVRLQAHDGSFDHLLYQPYQPFAFAGEVALDSTLRDGPTRDLNVMTRRGKVRAEVELVHTAFEQALATASVLVAVCGDWLVHGTLSPTRAREPDLWSATDLPSPACGAEAGFHGSLIRAAEPDGLASPSVGRGAGARGEGYSAPIPLHRNDALVWYATEERTRLRCAPASRHGEAALIRITFHPETVL